MWELDYKESWALKNWCFWTVVLEKTLESPLDNEMQPVHPKGNQSWIFIGGIDAEVEASILWLLDVKNWLIGNDPDAGKDWRREDKGTTEDEMVVWYDQLNKHEHVLWVGDGQGSLACCSPWGCKESDMTEWLNWAMHSKGSTVGQKVSGLEANPELGAHLDQPLHAVSSFIRLRECWHHESWG